MLTAKTIALALQAITALAQPLLSDSYPESDMTDVVVQAVTEGEGEAKVAWIEITSREGETEYLSQVWTDARDGGLVICEGYTRTVGEDMWDHLMSDENCTEIPAL